jgi:hypothetical protein
MSPQAALNTTRTSSGALALSVMRVKSTPQSRSEFARTDPPSNCTTPYVRAFFQAELSQFRAMAQTPGACAAALSAIDEEIDAARRFTHSLLSRRNAFAPISGRASRAPRADLPLLCARGATLGVRTSG